MRFKKKNGRHKLELHVHTRYSHDSMLSLPVLYWLCRIRGIDQIAITDHNTIDGAMAFKKYCKEHGSKIQVIIGEEIMTDSGEVIGLFLNENISGNLTVEDTAREIRKQGGLLYIPHPYDKKREKTVLKEHGLQKILGSVTCIESHNGRNIDPSFSKEQSRIAEKYRLQKTVGSDAHTGIEIGRNYLEHDMHDVESPEKFIKALSGSCLHQKQCIKLSHTMTKFVRVIKMPRKRMLAYMKEKFMKRIKM